MSRLPPLESLRVFEACARYQNFSRAAGELGVTPTAVSQRVRELEAELGRELFRRHGPRVSLTAPGAALAARLAITFSAIRGAVEQARADWPISVTAAPTFAARWLAPRLASYRAGEGIRIKVSASTELDGDHFDVAVRSGVGEWPGWRSMANLPLMGTPMLTPALAAGLSKPADLLGLRLLPDERWPSWFKAARVDQSGARFAHVEYPTQELAAAAAVDGAGVALLSPALFGSLTEKGRLVQPFEQVVEGPGAYHVLVRADEVRDQVLCFCNWLANSIKRPQPSATTKPASQVR